MKSEAKKAPATSTVPKKKFTVNASGKKVPVASSIAKPPAPAKAVPATAAAKATTVAKQGLPGKANAPGKIQQASATSSKIAPAAPPAVAP